MPASDTYEIKSPLKGNATTQINSLTNETGSKSMARCPEIEISIGGLRTLALLDTGSQITCISKAFYEDNLNHFRTFPTLPVVGTVVKGATGLKNTRINRQIMCRTQIGNTVKDVIFLIIPKLVRDCIIGIDSLQDFGAIIDTHKEIVSIKEKSLTYQNREIDLIQLEHRFIISIEQYDSVNSDLNSDSVLSIDGDEDRCFLIGESLPECGRNTPIGEDPYELQMNEIDEKFKDCPKTNLETINKLKNLIWKYRKIFNKKPGKLVNFEYNLDVWDDSPFFVKPYPIPINYRSQVREEIKKMLDWGIIRRSNSQYINPVVPVAKHDSSVRLCLDARKLNDRLVDDYESTRSIDEVLQVCKKIGAMTSLDLRSSYWQIPLTESSKKYTAFMHEGHVYEYNVAAFGIKNSGAALIRGFEEPLRGLEDFTLNFVDDLLIVSENPELHLLHLEKIFIRLSLANLTLNFSKCHFFCEKAEFLGYELTPKGLFPLEDKIIKIKNFAKPKNIKGLRGFLGLINFYSKFAENHSKLIVPLLELLKKKKKWEWGDTHQKSFEEIKDLFSKEVCLAYPNPELPYILRTDASDFAISGALSQLDKDHNEKVVTFVSRTLKGPELNMFTTEKELKAVVWSLEKLNSYIRASKIYLKMDHKALLFLFRCGFGGQRIQRWIMKLQEYNIYIDHVPGKENCVADFLSRQNLEGYSTGKPLTELTIALLRTQKFSIELDKLMRKLPEMQRSDESLKSVFEKIEKKEKNPFRINNNLLLKKGFKGGYRIVIPTTIIDKLIIEIHEVYGHIGAKKIVRMISEDFFIKNLNHRARKLLLSCDSCQKNKILTRPCLAPMENIIPEKPGDLLSVDFFGPLPATRGNLKSILITVDAFSRFVVLYPIRRQTTKTAIRKIFDDYIPKYGKVSRIINDHGSQFTSPVWFDKLEEENVKMILSSVRHPQSNICERTNRELGRFFRTFTSENHSGWGFYVKVIQEILNETIHDTTGFTPIELHLGKTPTRVWTKYLRSAVEHEDPPLETKIALARERILKKGKKRAEKYNKKHAEFFTTFEIGEEVLVKANAVSSLENKEIAKFFSLFEGPYVVQRKIGKNSYFLVDKLNERERGRFNVVSLRKYHRPQTIT